MVNSESGYREVEHTADWELEVWAPDFSSLLEQAAKGMYALAGIRLEDSPRQKRSLNLVALDKESLMVTFLSELLFLIEDENLGFDQFDIKTQNNNLLATLFGAPISIYAKEIKAVTYHNLKIKQRAQGLMVNVVFDV